MVCQTIEIWGIGISIPPWRGFEITQNASQGYREFSIPQNRGYRKSLYQFSGGIEMKNFGKTHGHQATGGAGRCTTPRWEFEALL